MQVRNLKHGTQSAKYKAKNASAKYKAQNTKREVKNASAKYKARSERAEFKERKKELFAQFLYFLTSD